MACIGCTGAIRSTQWMETLVGFSPLDMYVRGQVLMASLKLRRKNLWKSSRIRHCKWLKDWKWLKEAVIPMLCYGAFVWWSIKKQSRTGGHLSHIQRMAWLEYGSTPMVVMENLVGLPPANIYVRDQALNAFLRLQRWNPWKTSWIRRCRWLEEAVNASGDHMILVYTFKILPL